MQRRVRNELTLRTQREIQAVIDGNPFATVATKPAYLCVTFLSHAPKSTEVQPLEAQSFGPELR